MHTILDPELHREMWLVIRKSHGRMGFHRFALSQSIRDLAVDDTLLVPTGHFAAASVRSRVALVSKEWDGRRKFLCSGTDTGVQVKRVR